jgi:hypothetical protein
VSPASSPVHRFKRASIVDREREASGKPKPRRESAGRDSLKNPVLASRDETRSPQARKFFYCQISRLRVRARRFQLSPRTRKRIDCKSMVEGLGDGNTCGMGTSCYVDNRRYRFFAHYSHRHANVLRCCRSARAPCPGIAMSTLP